MRARWRALGLSLLLVACQGEAADSADPCARRPALTYDSFGEGLLEQHCTGCHSSLVPTDHREDAPPGIDFDTYEGVLTWAERIQARAVPEDAGMPPGGGPSTEERALLDEWLTCTVLPEAERWKEER